MNWEIAKSMLRNGGKITRPNWQVGHFWVMSKDGFERILCHNGTNARVHIEQTEADNWEIYEERRSLSDRECNVMVRCQLPVEVERGGMTGDKEKLIITEKGKMDFEKGFFKEDVKEAVKKLKEARLCGKISDEKINEIFGEKLCSK